MLVYLKDVFLEALTPCLLLYLAIKVALIITGTSARSGERPRWPMGLMEAVCLAKWRAGPSPSFSPRLALNSAGTGIITYQFPFPDLMIPEDFSRLGCCEQFVFLYSEGSALQIIPAITSLAGTSGGGSPRGELLGEQSMDLLQIS